MPRYAAFLRGISPMNARMPDLKRAFEPLFERLDRICGIAAPNDVVNMGVAVGQDIVTEGNRRMLYTTHALTGLARSLDAIPGRKHIVLYSGGYTLNLVNRVIDTVIMPGKN